MESGGSSIERLRRGIGAWAFKLDPSLSAADSKIVDVFRKNWDLRNAPDMMALNLIG